MGVEYTLRVREFDTDWKSICFLSDELIKGGILSLM